MTDKNPYGTKGANSLCTVGIKSQNFFYSGFEIGDLNIGFITCYEMGGDNGLSAPGVVEKE